MVTAKIAETVYLHETTTNALEKYSDEGFVDEGMDSAPDIDTTLETPIVSSVGTEILDTPVYEAGKDDGKNVTYVEDREFVDQGYEAAPEGMTGGSVLYQGSSSGKSGGLGSGSVVVLEPNKAIDGLIGDLAPLASKGGRSTQYQKSGGLDQANADFDALNLTNIRKINLSNGELGRMGTLSDGRKVIVRSYSSTNRPDYESQPTLEIQNLDKSKIKFRY